MWDTTKPLFGLLSQLFFSPMTLGLSSSSPIQYSGIVLVLGSIWTVCNNCPEEGVDCLHKMNNFLAFLRYKFRKFSLLKEVCRLCEQNMVRFSIIARWIETLINWSHWMGNAAS